MENREVSVRRGLDAFRARFTGTNGFSTGLGVRGLGKAFLARRGRRSHVNNEVWKTFAEHEVSHSMAHYLTTIHDLQARRGYARVSDVAKELDVTKGSASVQLKHLKEKGLVTEDDNRFLQLTEAGHDVAVEVMCNRQVIIRFFHRILGVERRQAETDACKIEHLLSQETSRQLMALVQLLQKDETLSRRFVERFRGFHPSCPSLENCGICEDVCLLEDQLRRRGGIE